MSSLYIGNHNNFRMAKGWTYFVDAKTGDNDRAFTFIVVYRYKTPKDDTAIFNGVYELVWNTGYGPNPGMIYYLDSEGNIWQTTLRDASIDLGKFHKVAKSARTTRRVGKTK